MRCIREHCSAYLFRSTHTEFLALVVCDEVVEVAAVAEVTEPNAVRQTRLVHVARVVFH